MTKKSNKLFQFDEVKYLLSPHGMVYRGIQAILIDHIIGSEGRYDDFDVDFLPQQDHTRGRWENIDVARIKMVELPPISTYKIGDYYFVRDGNHRVSVAREKGQEYIDAEIIELFSRVSFDSNQLNEKGLLLAESKKYFLEKSELDHVIPEGDIRLTHPWSYYRLLEHINTYKYLQSEKENRDIGWETAVKQWYSDVFQPTIELISFSKITERFPSRTNEDIYIWVMDHWHYLKIQYGETDLHDALSDYSKKFGKSKFKRLIDKIGNWINNKLLGGSK